MKKQISDELAKALGELAEAAGGDGTFHILTPRICDKCKDEDKEAFPYSTMGYRDLCNDCYAELEGFSYCDGCGLPEDMCVCDSEMPKPKIKIKWAGPGFYVAGHVTEDEIILELIAGAEKTYAWAMSAAMGKGFTHIVYHDDDLPEYIEKIEGGD